MSPIVFVSYWREYPSNYFLAGEWFSTSAVVAGDVNALRLMKGWA